MKITPLEIKQQQFEKSLRGYDVAEVQQFLTLVSNEYENVITKVRDLEDQIEKLSDRVRHYERVEEALHETLQTTKESVAQKMDNARLEVKNMIDKAHLEAESIVKQAHHDKASIRQNILRLLDKREEIIVGISSYLENASAAINKFKADELKVFSLEEAQEEPIAGDESNSVSEEDDASNGSKFLFDEEAEINPGFIETDNDSSFAPGADRLDDILDEID